MVDDKTQSSAQKSCKDAKRASEYSPPAVRTFGTVTDLTAAGSAGSPEGTSSSSNKQRP